MPFLSRTQRRYSMLFLLLWLISILINIASHGKSSDLMPIWMVNVIIGMGVFSVVAIVLFPFMIAVFVAFGSTDHTRKKYLLVSFLLWFIPIVPWVLILYSGDISGQWLQAYYAMFIYLGFLILPLVVGALLMFIFGLHFFITDRLFDRRIAVTAAILGGILGASMWPGSWIAFDGALPALLFVIPAIIAIGYLSYRLYPGLPLVNAGVK